MYLHSHPQRSGWHGLGESAASAKQVYAAQSRVRELTDRGFQNIFYDRNKLIVVAFWADSCRPCDAMASTVVAVANRIAQGPHANLVKFYHAQWDPAVNPRLHRQYGFTGIPLAYFYYMSSGKQPSNAQPLLESVVDQPGADAAAYLLKIENILRRHGHIAPPRAPAPAPPPASRRRRTIAESRGWNHSQALLDSAGFRHIDAILVAPSRVDRYLVDLARANPGLRMAKLARVVDRSVFDVVHQRIQGKLPDANTLGVVDPQTLEVYLLTMSPHLQVFLNSAVHEGVHLLACRARGHYMFYANYGFTLNEGFTQLVTEEILKAQKVNLTGSAYPDERAIAAKLVERVGFDAVADDYFRCTRNVFAALNAKGIFDAYQQLRIAAETTPSDAIRQEKFQGILRLLDTLPGR